MKYSPLITTTDLSQRIGQPGLRIVDCRFNLAQPEWGYSDYLNGHIPGAVYAHLDRDLAGPVLPHTGRHPLPDPEQFIQTLSSWGIASDTLVVVYDTVGGGFAARLWFMLRAIGHAQVQLLDGGYPVWVRENRPIELGPVQVQPRPYPSPARFDPSLLASTGEVETALGDPDTLLIDARAPERYQGLNEPIDPIAGHIPGAVNRFHGANLTEDGRFKTPQVLKDEFGILLSGSNPGQRIVYCGSGVTSCHHLLAMQIAGIPGGRLYAGSWSEWIRNPRHPIASGN